MTSIQINAIDTPDTLLHAHDAVVTARKTGVIVLGGWILKALGVIWLVDGIRGLIQQELARYVIPSLVLGGLIVFLPPLWRGYLRWAAQRMPEKIAFATLTFNDECVHIRDIKGDVVCPWKQLPKSLENEFGLLLMFDHGHAFWVDAAWFASQDELNRVAAWARHARKSDFIRPAKVPASPL